MKLTVLGSGTGMPSAARGGPAHLVQASGRYLLLDLGMGALAKLDRLHISLKAIGPILISHLHPDHTAELVSLLFALKNLGIGRTEVLQIFGCAGLVRWLENLGNAYGEWIQPKMFAVELAELHGNVRRLEDLEISGIPVAHTPGSVGFRFQDSTGRALAYSGDTDFCPGLIQLIRNADLAVVECSFPDQNKCPGHLTPSEAGQAAQEAGAKRLLLTHFYPECEGQDLLSQCGKYYDGETFLAHDFMEIQI